MRHWKWTMRYLLLSLALSFSIAGSAAEKVSPAEANIRMIKQIAAEKGVDPAICLAIAKGETTDFNPKAFNDNKNGKGEAAVRQSHGLFQLTLTTGKSFGIKTITDLYIAEKNARSAIEFIKYLLVKYPGKSLYIIAQMYNLGETRFHQGKTAIHYARRFMLYYHGFKQSPNGAV